MKLSNKLYDEFKKVYKETKGSSLDVWKGKIQSEIKNKSLGALDELIFCYELQIAKLETYVNIYNMLESIVQILMLSVSIIFPLGVALFSNVFSTITQYSVETAINLDDLLSIYCEVNNAFLQDIINGVFEIIVILICFMLITKILNIKSGRKILCRKTYYENVIKLICEEKERRRSV